MSVAYILNSSYSYVENSKLNPALEVGTSLKAPQHIINDNVKLTVGSTSSSLKLDADVVEALVIEGSGVTATGGAFVSSLNTVATDPSQTTIPVNAPLDMSVGATIQNLSQLQLYSGASTAGYVLSATDNQGTLAWVPDATGSTPSLSQVLAVGNDANGVGIVNLPSIGGVDEVVSIQNALTITSQLNVPTIFCGGDGTAGSLRVRDTSNNEFVTLDNNGNIFCKAITEAVLNEGVFLDSISKIKPLSGSSTAGYVLKAVDNENNIEWAPDATGTTPSLSQVLAVSGDGGNQAITNVSSLSTTTVNTSNINNGGGYINVDGNFNLNKNIDEQYGFYAGFCSIASISCGGSENFNTNGVIGVKNASNDITVVISGQYEEVSSTNFAGVNYRAKVGNDLHLMTDSISYAVKTNTTLDLQNNAIINASTVQAGKLLPTYKLQQDFYVSPNGNDASANGSIENPYATVGACITATEALTAVDNLYRYIHISGGDYSTETITITKKVHLLGEGVNSDACGVGCQLGAISLNMNTNGADMFNNQVLISGMLIPSITDISSSANYVLNLVNCYIYTPDRAVYLVSSSPSLTDMRLWMQNCQVLSSNTTSTNPLIELNKGMMKASLCSMTALGVQSVLQFSGSSRVDSITLCQFTSNTSSAVAPPIVNITSSTSSGFTFGNCAFTYSSATDKSANVSSTAIYCGSSSSATVVVLVYNVFALAGTSNASNFIITHGAIPCITFFFSNSATLNTTHTIDGTNNSTKFSLQAVA